MANKTAKHKSGAGFTLLETVIALGLGMITITMVMTIFANGLQYMRNMKDSQLLNSSATSFLNTVNYWVREGKIVDASSSLDILLAGDSHEIIGAPDLAVNGITATTNFTEMKKDGKITSVRINFFIQRGTENFSGTTTIAQRNF